MPMYVCRKHRYTNRYAPLKATIRYANFFSNVQKFLEEIYVAEIQLQKLKRLTDSETQIFELCTFNKIYVCR